MTASPGASATGAWDSPGASATGQRPDLRLWPPALGVWAGAAAVVLLAPSVAATAAVCGALLVLTLGATAMLRSWLHRRGRTALPVLVAAAVAASALGAAVRLAAVDTASLPEAGRSVQVTAVVDTDPERHEGSVSGILRGPDRVVFGATATSVTWAGGSVGGRIPVTVWAPASAGGLLPGSTVAVTARTRPGERGKALTLIARAPPALIEPAPPWQQWAGRLRAGLRAAVVGAPADGAAMLPALVLGDTSSMREELVDSMRHSGLSHLTAVSGANVSIVLIAALGVCAPLRIRGRLRVVVAGAALLGFLVLARPSPSVVRATAMGSVAVVCLLAGGRRRGPPALAAAVALLVLVDPTLSTSLGFALSVSATAGLLLLAPWILSRLSRLPVPLPVVQALAVTVAAQVVTAPLLVLVDAPVGLGAVPANLMAQVAVAPATLLGLAATLLAPISPGAAHAVAWLGAACAQWIAWVARTVAEWVPLPIPWPSGPAGALLAAAALAGGWLAVRHHGRLGPGPRAALATTVAAVTVATAAVPRGSPWPPPGWVAVVCDVGQGDAIVLRAAEGVGVVVDAGPEPRAVDRCLSDLGISRVAALVLTHFHADHVEGVPGVLRGREVGAVLVSPLADPVDEVDRVQRWADAEGLVPEVVTAGDRRQIGDVEWTVLWPARLLRAGGSAPNNASITVRVVIGEVSLLLGGDLEPAAQAALLADPSGLAVDVLKVPHHGSRRQHPRFAPASGAAAALISVGADNSYGHPAPETVAGLESRGVEVFRTDLGGDLAVVMTDDGRAGVVPRLQAE